MNKTIIFLGILLTVFFSVAPHWSILLGISLGLFLKFSSSEHSFIKTWSSRTLQGSIILLGAALNFKIVLDQGTSGLITSFIGISLVLISGEILARLFKVPSPLSTLISVGTAICGGSAIGALSPVLKADSFSITVAMGIVFILNAVAVFTFPQIGEFLNLSQTQFGTWAALAIHDTSAVVAASSLYGEESLLTATTLKLSRALWIIPVTMTYGLLKKSEEKAPYPWFIFLFLGISLVFTLSPDLHPMIPHLKMISRGGFSITLFLIGLSINREQLKGLKFTTLAFAMTLWLLTLTLSLGHVYFFVK